MTQLPLYGEAGMGTRYYVDALRIHWEVTLKDALMVVIIYLAIAVLLKNWNWPKGFNKGWIFLWITLPVWQGIVEYYSAYVYNRWEYSDLMPLIFGIGISPLLQMLLLPTIAILLSKPYLPNDQN